MSISTYWLRSFVAFWLLLLIVSILNPFDLYEVSIGTYMLLLAFISAYCFGFLFFGGKVNRRTLYSGNHLYDSYCRIVNNPIFRVLVVVLFFVLLYYNLRYSDFIQNEGIVDARRARFFSGYVFQRTLEAFVFSYFSEFLVFVCSIVVVAGIMFNFGFSKIWILALINCVLYLRFGGSRNVVLELGFIAWFFLILRKGFGLGNKKIVLRIILFAAISYALSVYGTAVRYYVNVFDEFDIVELTKITTEHLVVYFVGSFRAFDYARRFYTDTLGYGFGIYTLYGLDEIIKWPLVLIGVNLAPHSIVWGRLIGSPIYIGSSMLFNALYTALFNFYFDFGAWGVLWWGIILGMISRRVLSLYLSTEHPVWFILASFAFYLAMYTPLSLKLPGPIWFGILLLLLMKIISMISFGSKSPALKGVG